MTSIVIPERDRNTPSAVRLPYRSPRFGQKYTICCNCQPLFPHIFHIFINRLSTGGRILASDEGRAAGPVEASAAAKNGSPEVD